MWLWRDCQSHAGASEEKLGPGPREARTWPVFAKGFREETENSLFQALVRD